MTLKSDECPSRAGLLPEHIVEAIRDDPRHARNKVAKIARFGRYTPPNCEIRWLIWDPTAKPSAIPSGRTQDRSPLKCVGQTRVSARNIVSRNVNYDFLMS
jgi:hypothetical protein